MLDLTLKYLPLLIFIAPFLAWLDKAKRFSHRRKFYVERLEAAQTYIDKYYNKNLSAFEKDCAAQALICSEKIDHKKVDYLIEQCSQRFFFMADKLVITNHLIDIKEENGKLVLTAESTKARWKKVRILLGLVYCSSALVMYANEIAVYLMNKIRFLHPIPVTDLIYLTGTIIGLIAGIIVATIAGLLYRGVDSAIEIYDDLDVKYTPYP